MTQKNNFVALQQLEHIRRDFGGELGLALDMLTDTLRYEFRAPWNTQSVSPRAFAELHEAKAVISHLKYADPTDPVRWDDMAWAIKRVAELRQINGHAETLVKIAGALGIDLAAANMPADMSRKINNALEMMRCQDAPLPLTANA